MVLCGSFSACRKHLTLGKGPLFLLWIETMTPSRHHDAHVVHRHRPHRKLPMPWQHRQPWCCEQLIWSPATIFFPWKDYMTIQNETHTHIYIYTYIIIKGSWEAILPCYGQIEFCDLTWCRVVDHITIHNITIHNKRIRSSGIDFDEGWW